MTGLLSVGLALAGLLHASPPADPFFERWETLGTAQGLPSKKVLSVLADGPRVWAGTENGLALLEGGRVRRVYGAAQGLAVPVVISLAVSPLTGDLWVGTMGGLARLSGGRIDLFTQLNSGLANDIVYGVAVDGRDVWAATTAGLSRHDTRTGAWELFDNTNSIMHEPWGYAITASSGAVYAAVWGGGVLVRDAPGAPFREHRDPDGEMELDMFPDDGLIHDITTSIAYEDGVLWAGTYFGLSRYDGKRWRSYTQDDSGIAGDFINFLRAKGRAVWIATDQGVSRFDSEVWHTWRRRADGSGAELQLGEGGTSTVRALDSGPLSNEVFGVDVDRRGDAWVATDLGLSHAIARRKGPPETARRTAP